MSHIQRRKASMEMIMARIFLIVSMLAGHAAAFVGYDGKSDVPAPPHHRHRHHRGQAVHMLNALNQPSADVAAATVLEARANLVHSFGLHRQQGVHPEEQALRALCAEKGWKNDSDFVTCRKQVETQRCPQKKSTSDVRKSPALIVTSMRGNSAAAKHSQKQPAQTPEQQSSKKHVDEFSKEWCAQWWGNSSHVQLAHFSEEPKKGEKKEEKAKPEAADEDKDQKKKESKKDAPEKAEGSDAASIVSPAASPAAAPAAAPGKAISDLPEISEAEAFEKGGEFDTTQCASKSEDGGIDCVSEDKKADPPACYEGYRVVPLGGGRFTCWSEKPPDAVLPEQGYSGADAEHKDGDTWTSDFRHEYSPSRTYDGVAAEACKHNPTSWCIKMGYYQEESEQAPPPESGPDWRALTGGAPLGGDDGPPAGAGGTAGGAGGAGGRHSYKRAMAEEAKKAGAFGSTIPLLSPTFVGTLVACLLAA